MIWWLAYIFDPNHHTIRGLWVYSPTLDFRGKKNAVDGVHDWLVSEAAPPLISNCFDHLWVWEDWYRFSLNFDLRIFMMYLFVRTINGTHVEFSSLSLSFATMAIFASFDSMMQHKQSAKFIMMIIVRTRGSRSFARYEGKVYASLS